MIVLDTDTVTLLEHGHERTTERLRRATQEVVTTVITRIEILLGRFASVLKAEDGTQLLLAQQRLKQAESRLQSIPILLFGSDASAEFDRLRQSKKLKKIGRADLLIAATTLAFGRDTGMTRNVKHFRQVSGMQVENWAD